MQRAVSSQRSFPRHRHQNLEKDLFLRGRSSQLSTAPRLNFVTKQQSEGRSRAPTPERAFVTVNQLGAGGGRIPSAHHSGSGGVTLRTAVLGRERGAGREDGTCRARWGRGGCVPPGEPVPQFPFAPHWATAFPRQRSSRASDKALSGAAVYVLSAPPGFTFTRIAASFKKQQ